MTSRSVSVLSIAAGFAALPACSSDDASDSCDYTERMDTTNNSNVGGTPEATGITLGAAPITVCAQGNSGHYDTEDLDYDAFTISVGAARTAALTLTATDPPALSLFDVTAEQNSVSRGTATLGAQATLQLTTEATRLVVRVQNPAPIAASFAYRITLAPAAP